MYARDTALIATPVGTVRIDGDDDWVTAISIEPDGAPVRSARSREVGKAADQIREYFAAGRRAFDLRLAACGSARGQALRAGMLAIPYAQTVTYGQLARQLGSAARAVGQACARNRFPIVVPCHRVRSSSDAEHYSAGGGVTTKQYLLDHERRQSGAILS